MYFIKQIKNVFLLLKQRKLKDINIKPGEQVHCFKNKKLYGSCGCIYATQIEFNRQIEYKKINT